MFRVGTEDLFFGLPMLPCVGGWKAIHRLIGDRVLGGLTAVPLPPFGHDDETLLFQFRQGAGHGCLADLKQPLGLI